MKKQRAIVREIVRSYCPIPKEKELTIFFNDQVEHNYMVTCWGLIDGHGTATLEYYHITKKVDKKKAQDFLDKYCKLYNCEGEFVLREKFDYSVFDKDLKEKREAFYGAY